MNIRQSLKHKSFSLLKTVCLFAIVLLLLINNTDSKAAFAESIGSISTGTINYSDSSFYEGEILNDYIRNGNGQFTWNTGESYSGSWENDVINGKGELIWPNLGVYQGEFVNGKREGNGTFTWTYDEEPEEGAPVSYTGEWTNDQIGPSGTLVLSGIGTYVGEFSKQVRHGEGTFTWLNGDVYSGKWANDYIAGDGTLVLAENTILEGTFRYGVLSKGSITYNVNGGVAVRAVADGKVQAGVSITYNDGTVLVGNIRNQEFYGNVTINYTSGDSYTGTLKDGLKDGKGTYTWKNGAHYVGEWVEDKMSGIGKYYYGKEENKSYLSGTFSDGQPSGTLLYVSEDRLKYQTVWNNGKCTSIQYQGY